MKVHHSLICLFFFLSLQDGNTGLVDAQITVYSGIEGQNVTVQFSFSFGGNRTYFCKETCEENMIINTTVDRDQRGRYSTEYKMTSTGDVFVTITNLTKSDSGLYGCGLIGPGDHEYRQIRIIVVDAVLVGNPTEEKTFYTRTGGNIVVQCFFTSVGSRKYFCRDDCKEENILVQTTGDKVQKGRYSIRVTTASTGGSVFVSITQLNKSDSGRYRCAMDRPSSPVFYHEFNIVVTDDSTSSGPDFKLPASTTSVPSVSTPTTTTQSLSPQSDEQEPETSPTTDVVLYTVVSLVTVVIISGLVLMIICIQRKSKPDDGRL